MTQKLSIFPGNPDTMITIASFLTQKDFTNFQCISKSCKKDLDYNINIYYQNILTKLSSFASQKNLPSIEKTFSLNSDLSSTEKVKKILTTIKKFIISESISVDNIEEAYGNFCDIEYSSFCDKLTYTDFLHTIRHLQGVDKVTAIKNWIKKNKTQLATLIKLDLSMSTLSFIPEEINDLLTLEILDLSCNQLTTPPDVAKLTNLKTLNLSCNQLTTPPDVAKLTNLKTLNLSFNQLTTSPDVANLTSLEGLGLSYNQLTTPPDVTKLTNLKTLNLSSNQLTTSPDVANLTSLEVLTLSENHLTTFPDMSNLTHLQALLLLPNRSLTISSYFRALKHQPKLFLENLL
jgi:hypothetical protein